MREALERRAADWLAKKTGRSGPMFTAHTFARIAAWMAEFLLACIEDGTLAAHGLEPAPSMRQAAQAALTAYFAAPPCPTSVAPKGGVRPGGGALGHDCAHCEALKEIPRILGAALEADDKDTP